MNRATALSSPTKCGWTILTATVRPSVVCSARYTRPMPPIPTSSKITYPPGKVRPINGSSESFWTCPTGNPHEGQNLCEASQEKAHCGHVRIDKPSPPKTDEESN